MRDHGENTDGPPLEARLNSHAACTSSWPTEPTSLPDRLSRSTTGAQGGSGRDAVCRVLAEGQEPGKVALKDVMTANPDTLLPSSNAIDALRLMQNGGYRHVPIVENGEVAGIVSRGDFRGIELDRLDEETGLWERI